MNGQNPGTGLRCWSIDKTTRLTGQKIFSEFLRAGDSYPQRSRSFVHSNATSPVPIPLRKLRRSATSCGNGQMVRSSERLRRKRKTRRRAERLKHTAARLGASWAQGGALESGLQSPGRVAELPWSIYSLPRGGTAFSRLDQWAQSSAATPPLSAKRCLGIGLGTRPRKLVTGLPVNEAGPSNQACKPTAEAHS